MRLNKYLAELGIDSRRGIDRMIEEKRIEVNGILATAGIKVCDDDRIFIDKKEIKKDGYKKSSEKLYFILNKPLKVLSSAKDDRGRKTVVDMIDTDTRIFPIGRLDYNTTGLIILTNDGELFNRVIHPKSEVYKTYVAKVLGEIKDENIERLRSGIELEDGKTLPAKVRLISRGSGKSEVEISIREGKNRQIRRMLDEVKTPVISLKRVSIGKLTLGKLKVGEYRTLTKEEIGYLYSL